MNVLCVLLCSMLPAKAKPSSMRFFARFASGIKWRQRHEAPFVGASAPLVAPLLVPLALPLASPLLVALVAPLPVPFK